MNHNRLVALAVFADVFKTKTGRQCEVELNGRELPEPAENVDQLDVDLRSVEGSFAGDGLVGNSFTSQCALQRIDGQIPILVGAGVGGAVFGIPGGELDFEFVEAEGLEHGRGEVDAGYDFIFNLTRHAEDVRIVLCEAANAQQPMHGAGALVAIDVAELGVARGQVAIALGRIFVDEDVAGTVHRLETIFGIVQLHGRVHVAGIVAFVAADLPKFATHDVGGEDQVVAAAKTLFAHPVFHDLADDAALGVPEDEACPGPFLNA